MFRINRDNPTRERGVWGCGGRPVRGGWRGGCFERFPTDLALVPGTTARGSRPLRVGLGAVGVNQLQIHFHVAEVHEEVVQDVGGVGAGEWRVGRKT